MEEIHDLADRPVDRGRVNSRASSPAAQRFYRPGLDVLRFIAFFCVFLSHTLGFYAGSPWSIHLALQGGMCLFFVLSSYLITELLLREQQATGSIHLRAFFMRRILRIWPLYFAALGLGFVTGLIWPPMYINVSCLLAHLLLLGNWYNVLRQPMNSPWQPLWSISLEEQFYLLWPFLMRKGRIYIWTLSLLTFPVAALTLLYCAGKLNYGPMARQIWFNSLVQFQYFGLGAILALTLGGKVIKWRPYQQVLLGLVSAALLYATGVLFAGPSSVHATIFGYLLIGAGCVALFLAMAGDNCSGFKRVFVDLGKISYGLYVFHVPCLTLTSFGLTRTRILADHPVWQGALQLTTALFLTILVSKLSYRYFEKPFLRLKEGFEFIKTRNA